ncbi:aspartate aminotransferase family protein [bacterium]|nr:aspartate aminotransferase family protein [bacterium]
MKKEEIKKLYEDYVIGCYTKSDFVFVKGEGSYLYDLEGKKYLDFFPGWAVSGLGHCHPEIVKAIKKQAEILIHLPNNHYHPWQAILAKKLSEISFEGKVFFCNSGAEANEAAIKLVRLYGRNKGKYKIISMENSFHGRTLATVTMTGQKKYNEPFKPLPSGFSYVPFNDFSSLEKSVDEETAGIILELIQGEGGINVIDREYLFQVKELCEKKDILLIFDEVQTGFGRTGTFFAYQQFGVEPDIMTLAKTLGGGFPVGAMIAKKEIADFMTPGTHASTFGGSPLACVCCLAVIETIEKENLLENVKECGEYLKNKLEELKDEFQFIKKIKGMGLMLAFEIEGDGNKLMNICGKNGLLINCTHGNVMRIMPAINVKKEEIDMGIELLKKSLSEFSNNGGS